MNSETLTESHPYRAFDWKRWPETEAFVDRLIGSALPGCVERIHGADGNDDGCADRTEEDFHDTLLSTSLDGDMTKTFMTRSQPSRYD